MLKIFSAVAYSAKKYKWRFSDLNHPNFGFFVLVPKSPIHTGLIFSSGFFHESPCPKPLIITLGSFQIFSKIRGDIHKSRCTTGVNDTGGKLPPVSTTPANLPPVSTTPAANFATSSPCVVDTGGKFATGVNDTGGKFAAGVNYAGGNLPPVSTTPAASLPPVSLTPVANNGNNIRLQTTEVNLKAKISIYVSSTTQR